MSFDATTSSRYAPQPSTAPESLSLVDRYTVVDGTFTTTRDVRIEGELRGTLRCDGFVHVAEGAVVEATVEAGSITVAGQLRGTVTCRGKLTIVSTGQVHGNLTTRLLVVEEGGRCEGEIAMDVTEAVPRSEPAVMAARFAPRRPERRERQGRDEEAAAPLPKE